MSDPIQLRQQNPEETENMAQYQSPDGDAVCASYVARDVADRLGEFAAAVISASAEVNLELASVSGNGTGNYAVYETPGGAITGFYLSHDVWSEAIGEEVERADDGQVTNAPESLGILLRPSDEDAFDEADSVDEDEVDALVGGDDDSDEEEVVEIEDEELGLVDAE